MDYKKTHRISPEYVLLGFLYRQPAHGYELNQMLEKELGYIWHVSQSQTYNILKRLESQGYITSAEILQGRLPRRQVFQLTERGKQHFIAWLEAPTQCSVHAIRVEFITRLYFLQRYQPEQFQDLLRDQSEEVRSGLRRLEITYAGLPADQIYSRLALDLRIKLLHSILSWLQDCQEIFINILPETDE